MTELGYQAAPPIVRRHIDPYLLDRYEQLDETTAAAIDAALTITNGPMLRALANPKRGKAGVPDPRSLDIQVMLPDFAARTWRVWFTVRLRGAPVRELVRMLTWQAPDDPAELLEQPGGGAE